MPWVLAGVSPNTTLPSVEEKLFDFIKNNWLETQPAVSEIKFGRDWWDDYGDFQIHIRHMVTTAPKILEALGGRLKGYITSLDIHMFTRVLSEQQDFPALENMNKEVDRILNVAKNTQVRISPGMLISDVTDMRSLPEDTNIVNVWHDMVGVQVTYFMNYLP